MSNESTNNLLRHLIKVTEDVSMGQYGKHNEIFELTKTGHYPEIVTRLAEAFGMMIVKVEARELHLEKIIEDLKKTQAELLNATQELNRENIYLKRHLRNEYAFSTIIGTSRAIKEVLSMAQKISDLDVNVLINGETGTGKELFAKAIHYSSSRSEMPFVAVNCSAIPESLFESEMFGIEKGVATGVNERIGKLEIANGGTIFLDEIGDMPLSCQAKILRVIEDLRLEKVGSRKPKPIDIRIIAATHKDLKKEVQKGTFREDLFYRLNVVNLKIPALRERTDDIVLLTNFFLSQYSRKFGKNDIVFANDTLELFKRYPWYGNIRELENEIERAVALTVTNTITTSDLSEELRTFQSNIKPIEKDEETMKTISTVLKDTGGNKTQAAKRLGLSREGLRKKMKRLGI